MKTEDKIKEFELIALEEAERIRRNNLKEINLKIKEEAQKGLKKAELISKQKVDRELYSLTQLKNKQVLEAKTLSKITLINLREEYKNDIFSHVEKKLYAFTNTTDYVSYLIESLGKILDYTTKIYLTQKDMVYKNLIQQNLSSYLDIIESKEDFIGGFKAVMVNKNIIIDNSFKAKLLQEKERFRGFKIV